MRVFSCALRVVAAHPAYLLVYVGFLSAMGLFITVGLSLGDGGDFEPARPDVAVVDRDGGALGAGLAEFLAAGAEVTEVDDEPFALQDAVATGQVSCLIIVPEGFTDDFLAAVRAGDEPPVLDVAFGPASMEGMLAGAEASQYLGLARAAAVLLPGAPAGDVAARAVAVAGEQAVPEVVVPEGSAASGNALAFYLKWCAYTLTAAIVVSVGLLMGAFSRTDVRRRNLVSPASGLGLGLREAAACLVVTVGVAAVVAGAGWAAFGSTAAGLPPAAHGLMLLAVAVLALVPLSIGFLLGQLGVGETASNAVGNILGMVLTFLGGAWVPLSLMPEAVVALARFTPVYWYTDALDRCAHLVEPTTGAVGAVLGDLGLVALFAAAVFGAALVAGRLRLQSAEAGGNAAAAPGRG
ncbi:ABC transporter permease [Adlercreutzia faecimuris]|uniref:ABC transporter permease n=1 Tax=Adlercreutzia faecimuris TaxID=2897341 RepID=A0ABS9WID0_9ACTN|nr:ABC transporter permease [Adlercreutzia sp. JBNU-10]MCI2242629.1 ABC transporter permease [Adlercreutzia sp. JBNU-10]